MLTAIVALPAFVVLIAVAPGAVARTTAAIYGLGVCAMFAVSATFHRLVHSLRARVLWQRADHATIYAAIAGTSTPICLLAMPRTWGLALLGVIWIGAIAGVLLKTLAFGWRRAELVGGLLYIVLGWSGSVSFPFLWHHSGPRVAISVLVGGVLYTIGAIGFALERPRLRPAVFGYHEVWHLYTIVAACVQFVAIWTTVTR